MSVKTCNNCENCYDLDKERIIEYLYAIDREIVKYTENYVCTRNWGYGCVKAVSQETFEKLLIIRDYISYYYDSLKFNFGSNICPEEIEKVLEQTSKLISLNFDFIQNKTYIDIKPYNYDVWVAKHPFCVAWEDWEQSFVNICPEIGFSVKNLTDSCNLALDFITKKVDACEVAPLISVANLACKTNLVDYTINDLSKCEIDYNLLIKKYDCSFTFDTYIKLLENNLSNKIISGLLEAGVDIDCDEEGVILLIADKEYRLSNLDLDYFSQYVNPEILNELFDIAYDNPTYTKQELIDSYNSSHDENININE